MDKLQTAIQCFNDNNFAKAEEIALNMYKDNPKSIDAVDVLCAIYLKINNLHFLHNASKNNLNLIREMAGFLEKLGTYEQAVFFYKKALEIEPKDFVGLNNLGLTYENLDKMNEAQICYEKSLTIQNNYPALYNLGVLHRKNKKLDLSEKYLLKAIKLSPTNEYANYSLGMTYFMQKNFEKGYPYFLKRPVKNIEHLHNFWDGKPYNDMTILVFCEYGLGDAIMFSRYFPLLKNYFKAVKVLCNKSLISLFQNSFKDVEFYSDINEIRYDYCVLSMNLPYYLKLDFDNIPAANGYLKANDEKVKVYKEKYFNTDKLKVGIFYVGGELTKRNAKYRAIELKNLNFALNNNNNIQTYSFQKDDVFGELKDFPHIIDLGKGFNDFSDTAAAMKNLDLFITIDSAPVHLAGALGIKTTLLLPYYSEWRWFEDETQTPWYDSVKLIRQTTPCDWQDVVTKINF